MAEKMTDEVAAAPLLDRSGLPDERDAEIARLTAQKDAAYAERDRLVAALGKLALRVGGECWLGRHDPADTTWDDDWRHIVYVRFPETGQLSWHVHDSEASWFMSWINFSDEGWDGHTTDDKYARLERLGAPQAEEPQATSIASPTPAEPPSLPASEAASFDAAAYARYVADELYATGPKADALRAFADEIENRDDYKRSKPASSAPGAVQQDGGVDFVLDSLRPAHVAAVIGDYWRYTDHRHNMGCSDGKSCASLGTVVLRLFKEGRLCPTCDGEFVSKRGDDKGYSCRCHTGVLLPAAVTRSTSPPSSSAGSPGDA